MIAPLALVIDVDSLFALSCRLNHGPIGFNHRLLEERIGLLFPDLGAGFIEDFLETVDVVWSESSAEIASRCWVGPFSF